jgi:hypothetical protein
MVNALVERLISVLDAEPVPDFPIKVGALAECLIRLLILRFGDEPDFVRQMAEGFRQRLCERVAEVEGIQSDHLN